LTFVSFAGSQLSHRTDAFEQLSKGDGATHIAFDEESAFIAEAEWLAQQFDVATSRDGLTTAVK